MLVSFVSDKTQIPTIYEYSQMSAQYINEASARMQLSTIVPMIFANSENLAPYLTNYCVECNGILRADVKQLNLSLIYVELPNRYGYLLLYKTNPLTLLYAVYCGEITLTLAVKNIFENKNNGGCRNFCLVAPIGSVVTAQEPYATQWNNLRDSFVLSSFSYINLNGNILKCKRVGRQGRDLEVVDKFYINNKIPDLQKALSNEPTCLIDKRLLVNKIQNNKYAMQQLSGKRLPVAHLAITTALSDIHNNADLIVAIANTPQQDGICARLTNDWLKRAVKHKLNKFPPERTSDGKYDVQQLTTEATIKYQGDTWKGAEQTDKIYLVTEVKTGRTLHCISIGKNELYYLNKRLELVQLAISQSEDVIENIQIELINESISKKLLGNVIVETYYSEQHGAAVYEALGDSSEVLWKDLFEQEFNCMNVQSTKRLTVTSEILTQRKVAKADELEKQCIYFGTDGSISKTTGEYIGTISRTFSKAKSHSFNFPTITVKIKDKTYKGSIKFGFALLKNIEDNDDTFPMCVPAVTTIGRFGTLGTLTLSDYVFCSWKLHDAVDIEEKWLYGRSVLISQGIYGKKYTQIGSKFRFGDAIVAANATSTAKAAATKVATTITTAFSSISKAVSTGIEQNNTLSSELSLGYLPDTYEEYQSLIAEDTIYVNNKANSKATITIVDEDDLLDQMEDLDELDEELLAEMDDGDDDDYYEDDFNDDELGTDDNPEDSDDFDDLGDFDEDDLDDSESNNWQLQRTIWLSRHSTDKFIVHDNEKVYWFDVVHILMIQDQPENADNIDLLKQVWQSITSKMTDYSEEEIINMMFEQIKSETEGVNSSSTDAPSAEASVLPQQSDITDDDDDLFADL